MHSVLLPCKDIDVELVLEEIHHHQLWCRKNGFASQKAGGVEPQNNDDLTCLKPKFSNDAPLILNNTDASITTSK